MALTVRVITPDKTVWDEATVQEVILPSTSGQLGILPNHAPLITALDIGVMRVRPGKDWQNIAIYGGFAEVEANEVKVLVNAADLGSKIDKEAARVEFEKARTHLDDVSKGEDRSKKIKAGQAFKRARAKFQAAGGMVPL